MPRQFVFLRLLFLTLISICLLTAKMAEAKSTILNSEIGAVELTPLGDPPQEPAPQQPSSPPAIPSSAADASASAKNPTKDSKSNDQKPTCWTDPKNVGRCGGPWLRTIVGFEQAGVSAAQSQQDFFFDIYYDRPIGLRELSRHGAKKDVKIPVDKDLGDAFRTWGNLRISSVPQQISTDVATFATTFAAQVGQLKVNEVAQAFEFLGGVQYRLWSSGVKPDYASSDPIHDPNVHNRVSINFILGGGVITPLSPKSSVQLFSVPANQPTFFITYPQAVGKQYVAFTLPDRNRFFRQGYGGLRLMTHFLGDSRVRAPETFDLTYGVNESVTGGRIRGGVMRLEGFVPIPYDAMSWIYLFGTGMFKPGAKSTVAQPFLLDSAPTNVLPTDPNAVVIQTPQADRDYYRVGLGIDLVDLVAAWRSKKSDQSNQTPTPSPGPQ